MYSKSVIIIQLNVQTVKSHLPDLITTEAYVYLLDRHLVEQHPQVINRFNMDHLLTSQNQVLQTALPPDITVCITV